MQGLQQQPVEGDGVVDLEQDAIEARLHRMLHHLQGRAHVGAVAQHRQGQLAGLVAVEFDQQLALGWGIELMDVNHWHGSDGLEPAALPFDLPELAVVDGVSHLVEQQTVTLGLGLSPALGDAGV